MSEDEKQQAAMTSEEEAARRPSDDDDDDEVGSPFEHPAFLPVLLTALAIWFGHDGWFNESIEAVNFNRYGFVFLLGGAICATAIELTTIRFLFPGLLLAYGIWLLGLDLLGTEGAWYKDPEALFNFNRWAGLACVAAAAIQAFRESRR
jgi:hypothetical protein